MRHRLGVTMRVERAASTGEVRDAIAQDWGRTLTRALGDVPWMPIPNVGTHVGKVLTAWEIDAVILTGGNDLGSCPSRDETETEVLDYCGRHRIPVLAVCRGLQLMQAVAGGRVVTAPAAHAGTAHDVALTDHAGRALLGAPQAHVNSFHRRGVAFDDLAPSLEAWALSADGFVEGLRHRTLPQLAVQWHPERALAKPELGLRLIRSLYGG